MRGGAEQGNLVELRVDELAPPFVKGAKNRVIGFPFDEVERAAVAIVLLSAPRGVDGIAERLREERQHRAVVGCGIEVIAGRRRGCRRLL
ncbi:MAG: hypothetical protein QM736_14520 [Vicinamibacterales bacterium]